jgi:hypothetical protein
VKTESLEEESKREKEITRLNNDRQVGRVTLENSNHLTRDTRTRTRKEGHKKKRDGKRRPFLGRQT